MNILIVEDELIISEMMSIMLQELDYNILGMARNYDEAIEYLISEKIDIVLIDINLGSGKNGIELANYINNSSQLPFVFVTSNADVVTVNAAKKEKPFGYLQKPFNQDDLYAVIEIARLNFNRKLINRNQSSLEKNHLFIKDGTSLIKVLFDDLLFVKSDGNYLELHTNTKKYLIRNSLKEFKKELPKNLFLNSHRSYIVNLNKIESIGSNFLILNDIKIPLVRNYREELINLLNT